MASSSNGVGRVLPALDRRRMSITGEIERLGDSIPELEDEALLNVYEGALDALSEADITRDARKLAHRAVELVEHEARARKLSLIFR